MSKLYRPQIIVRPGENIVASSDQEAADLLKSYAPPLGYDGALCLVKRYFNNKKTTEYTVERIPNECYIDNNIYDNDGDFIEEKPATYNFEKMEDDLTKVIAYHE